MKRWVIATITTTDTTITVTGTSGNKKTGMMPFSIVLCKNNTEAGAMAVHTGTIQEATGCTEAAAKRVMSHIAACHLVAGSSFAG